MNTLKVFYEETKTALFNYTLRLCGDYDLASDIAHDAYIKTYEAYGENISKQLLYVSAKNIFIDYYRKNRKNVDIEHAEGLFSNGPEASAIIDESYKMVINAMQHLDIDEREILSLRTVEEYSYKEIAEITGLSEANVKVKIHRARKRIKEILGGRYERIDD